jgi:hypothetical protein
VRGEKKEGEEGGRSPVALWINSADTIVNLKLEGDFSE